MADFVPRTEEQILRARIGQVQPLNGRIVLVDYDPEWPRLFERETSAGSPEIERMLLFRDWLRTNAADRELYLRTKRDLAQRQWQYTQNYADAKSAVVSEIVARAESARGAPLDL
jgi:GrpB-like predicted nucleotidyltransferase (UPF0157 family)